MAVLLYQIGIFIAIQIAAIFGKSSRNTAVILISIFTILQVYMSWLLLLQFITIYFSYNISKNWFSSENKSFEKQSAPSNLSNVKHRYNVFDSPPTSNQNNNSSSSSHTNTYSLESENEKKARSERIKQRIANYNSDNDPDLLRYQMTNVHRLAKKSPEIRLYSKLYYIEHSKVVGPITANKFILSVKEGKINRNCFVKVQSQDSFEMRAYEIVEMLDN